MVNSTKANLLEQQLKEDYHKEIEELETLIQLQQKKLELLQTRKLIPGYNERLLNGLLYGHSDGLSTVNPIQIRDTNNDIRDTNNNIELKSINDRDDLERQKPRRTSFFNRQMTVPGDEHTLTFSEWLYNLLFPEALVQGRPKVDAVEHFHRLGTDLANERTLLAWIRTCLAFIRTTGSIMGLKGLDVIGDDSVKTLTLTFALLALWTILQGSFRYRKIKGILAAEEPPRYFHRLSNYPIILFVVAAVILETILISTNAIEK